MSLYDGPKYLNIEIRDKHVCYVHAEMILYIISFVWIFVIST